MTDPNAHQLYHSRNNELVVYVSITTKEILIVHDLKKSEVPKLRIRAINTLKEQLPDLESKICEYAPGAKTRLRAERDRDAIKKAVEAIQKMWPEAKYGAEPPAADAVPNS